MNKQGMKMVLIVYMVAAFSMSMGSYLTLWAEVWGWSTYTAWCVALMLLASVPAIIAVLIEKLFGS